MSSISFSSIRFGDWFSVEFVVWFVAWFGVFCLMFEVDVQSGVWVGLESSNV